MDYIVETGSREETADFGKRLGSAAKKGQVYALTGDLGAGKTVLAQGFARGLGITEPVTSPTFTIMQVYEGGRLPLYHFDIYRIGDLSEMDEIGYEEYVYGDGVSLIEWAGLIADILPEHRIDVIIEKDPAKGYDYRRIRIKTNNHEITGE